MLFTWNLSPLRSSRFSLLYLLLPPRSALGAVSVELTRDLRHGPHALLLMAASHLPPWPRIGGALKRHPFSGLADSAGELLHTP